MATVNNCWEFKNCGREIGGIKVKEMGVCPALQITVEIAGKLQAHFAVARCREQKLKNVVFFLVSSDIILFSHISSGNRMQ
jgi:hypothetical protein